MNIEKLCENDDFLAALAWLGGQDLSETTPEEAKRLLFDAFYRMKKTNVERYC